MHERCYVGERLAAGCRAYAADADGETCCLTVRRSDPLASFGWGRPGVSSNELAWALLLDATRSRSLADDWCGAFGLEVVARLPRDGFRLPAIDVMAWTEQTVTGRRGARTHRDGPLQRAVRGELARRA